MNTIDAQRSVLIELFPAIQAQGIPYWLCGGWGVDLVTGHDPREHYDIDAFIWRHDAVRLRAWMEPRGWEFLQCRHPEESDFYRKDGVIVDFLKMHRRDDGHIYTADRGYHWGAEATLLGSEKIMLGSACLTIVPPRAMLDIKLNFAAQSAGMPLREKDIRDIEVLQAYLNRTPGGRADAV